MRRILSCFIIVFVSLMLCSCATHGTADHWNDLVGQSGDPVHLDSTTKVGFNFLVIIPFAGRNNIDGMVREATRNIREKGGDYVRVIQGDSENYWYGLPPFTWILTPVVSTLVVEYRPGQGEAMEGVDPNIPVQE